MRSNDEEIIGKFKEIIKLFKTLGYTKEENTWLIHSIFNFQEIRIIQDFVRASK